MKELIRGLLPASVLALAFSVALSAPRGDAVKQNEAQPDTTFTLLVGHRVFPDFREVHKARLNQREYIGDTDYSFEIVEFYPHFAFVDSTKEIVSLSDEPKNVAVKIVVYENDEIVQNEWAFFNLSAPHFRMNSIIWFQVVEFEYRGEVYKRQKNETEEAKKL
jgi:hypothetical protein